MMNLTSVGNGTFSRQIMVCATCGNSPANRSMDGMQVREDGTDGGANLTVNALPLVVLASQHGFGRLSSGPSSCAEDSSHVVALL